MGRKEKPIHVLIDTVTPQGKYIDQLRGINIRGELSRLRFISAQAGANVPLLCPSVRETHYAAGKRNYLIEGRANRRQNSNSRIASYTT